MENQKNKLRKLVVDLDSTISVTENGEYTKSKPVQPIIDLLKQYQKDGFQIIIYSSRQMRTYDGQIGKINKYTLPIIIHWLTEHDVPFDEIIVGKPWCGYEGWYIDDRSIRPSEFYNLSKEKIEELLEKEKEYIISLTN